MEREYHNLHDYFTNKYPRYLECEALEDAPEFKPLLNKLYELFKGMKISDDFDNKIVDNPKDISCPEYGYFPDMWNNCILCIEMTELGGLKGFQNYDQGIFSFGFSKITPEIFINDIQKILEYNPELKSVGAIFRKYVEIKTPSSVINLINERDNNYKIFKKRINELNPEVKIREEQNLNKKIKDMENKINRISEWLNKNSDNINFNIGKELYDIINS